MRPHRWAGNRLLTHLTSFVARRPLADAQSGYRALSAAAATDAEVIHDFNYAQVLTLDLLAKGHRYAEVPISYAFRTTGRSFVRLLPYLRRVIPAVMLELQSSTTLDRKLARADAHAVASSVPSRRRQAAAARPIASA